MPAVRRPTLARSLRALAGALSLAVAAGCGAITESEAADDVSGRYLLTHYNAAPVPVVTDEVPAMVEELRAGDVVMDAGADSTFAMALVWRDTYRPSGTSEDVFELFRGTFTKRGSAVRFTVTEEDGEAEPYPWTIAGELRAGVLRVTLEDDENAALTFRRE